jgi:hypothetical protein
VDRYGELPIETGGRLRGEFFLSDLGLQELEEPVFRGDARE